MSDPRPYVPADGVRVSHRGRVYRLREVGGERLLFNVQALTEAKTASYRLEGIEPHPEHYYNVLSARTGKRMPGLVTCFMARVYRDRHTPKFPLWRWE
jgi:hypothetical protein